MTVFSTPHDPKQRLLQNLQEAICALQEDRLELVNEVVVNGNADANGFCRQKDTMFFGFEFRLKQRRAPSHPPLGNSGGPGLAPAPAVAAAPEPLKTVTLESPSMTKMTSGQAERCKVAGVYTCPKCQKFTTDSATGLKKHANRCAG